MHQQRKHIRIIRNNRVWNDTYFHVVIELKRALSLKDG